MLSTLPGFDPARAVDPAPYGAASRPPRLALKPATREELVEAMRAAARDGLRVIPFGGPPDASLAAELPPADLALDLSALDRMIEYEPEDLTVTAECGVTLATLRATLAARGQELPLEAPGGGRTTLGGALAANASGPRRLRFGAPRDRILGARFVLGDGTLARSGGKVVKNVAGYAIHRLLCGSRGGLAVLVEASLKLLPSPERRAALLYPATAEQLRDRERWAEFPRFEPAALTVLAGAARAAAPQGPEAPYVVALGFEDDEAWVQKQVQRAVARLGRPAAERSGAEAEALWQALADGGEAALPRLTFTTAHNTPAALAPVLDLAPEGFVFHAPAGRLHLHPGRGAAQAAVERLAAHGFALIAACGAGEIAPVLPPQQAVLALRASIRAALDPGRILALGERWERGEL
ncbi:MAG TPA: FAD-binding oxidoreductase [Candidatus Eisenbacteria bacterium]|jgi:glycolate oxidase FAD binding subunit